jgi:hypothetical protein
MPYLCCLCLFVCSGVQHVLCGVFGLFIFVLCTLCCQCLWVVFVLCLVYTMLPVSLGCLRLVSCVHYVASVSGLSSCCVLCTLCCQCLWVVFVLCLVYTMLPVSLGCLRLVSCVHYVASVSGLSSSCVLCTLCCQCLWVVFVLCLVHTMLPVSGCQLFIAPSSCVHYVASVSGLSILYCPFRIFERLFTRLRMITLVRFNVRRIKLATLLSIFIYIYLLMQVKLDITVRFVRNNCNVFEYLPASIRNLTSKCSDTSPNKTIKI